MTQEKANNQKTEDKQRTDEEGIEEALSQMDLLVKSRCVQSPVGKNVVVREIVKDTK